MRGGKDLDSQRARIALFNVTQAAGRSFVLRHGNGCGHQRCTGVGRVSEVGVGWNPHLCAASVQVGGNQDIWGLQYVLCVRMHNNQRWRCGRQGPWRNC